MLNRKISNIAYPIIYNGSISLVTVFLYKYVSFALNMDSIIIWIDEDTKKFAGSVFILFVILMLTVKLQFRVIKKLKKSYPWSDLLFKYAFILFITGVLAFITNYFLVYFQVLKDPIATLQWVVENTRIYFAGALFLFFVYLLAFALIGNIYISSIIMAIVVFVIGFVHYNKLNLRVEPLYPSDFSQMKQMKDVIPMVKEYLSIKKMIFSIIMISIILFSVKFFPKVKLLILERALLLLLTAGIVLSFIFSPPAFMKDFVEKTGNVSIIKWNQIENFKKNGLVFAFISNLQIDAFEEPEGYSKQKVLATAKKYLDVNSDLSSTKEQEQKPNIVYIMSEAFWDPTKLKNVQFSEDPMKNLRKLMEQYSSGYNLSPVFGGATANVEFEAVTGYSNYFLKHGILPYQDLIDRKKFIPTIVSDLEEKGYQSVAIHPYNKVFYKRNIVYQTFGFDQFLDMSTMKYQEKSGPYISDESLSKEILDQLEKAKNPMFIHAVSVQNHFPYTINRGFEEYTIDVSGLSPKSNETLEVYAEGIKQADAALQLLIDQLEELDEPTIVVFWGDHLPVLGQDLAIYKEANYSNPIDKNQYEKDFAETPLLIYANYPTEKQQLHSLSPIYFGPTVYEMAGLKKPPFYKLLDLLKEELPGLKNTVQIDGNQHFKTNGLSKKQKELLKDYELLEYDLLIGKQYSKDLLFR